jgi:hypothetical protein
VQPAGPATDRVEGVHFHAAGAQCADIGARQAKGSLASRSKGTSRV